MQLHLASNQLCKQLQKNKMCGLKWFEMYDSEIYADPMEGNGILTCYTHSGFHQKPNHRNYLNWKEMLSEWNSIK